MEISTKNSLAHTNRRVNNNSRRQRSKSKPHSNSNRLILTVLEHPDGSDGIYLAPLCDACNQPILDQELLNVCVERAEENAPLEFMGRVGLTKVQRIPGIVRFFHKACDTDKLYPWFDGDQIFRKQQVFRNRPRLVGRAA